MLINQPHRVLQPRQPRHLQSLLMVRNHASHKLGITRCVARICDFNCFFGRQFTRELAGRTGLDDRTI